MSKTENQEFHISQKLPQFESRKVLLAVFGFQRAHFYFAFQGKIKQVVSWEIKNPHYSRDRKSFFMRRVGRVFGAGGVYKPKNKAIEAHFHNQAKDKLRKAVEDYKISEVYLFSPKYEIKHNQTLLAKHQQHLVKDVFKGNFADYYPLDLLSLIEQSRQKQKEFFLYHPLKKQAKKLMDKARQAAKVAIK